MAEKEQGRIPTLEAQVRVLEAEVGRLSRLCKTLVKAAMEMAAIDDVTAIAERVKLLEEQRLAEENS